MGTAKPILTKHKMASHQTYFQSLLQHRSPSDMQNHGLSCCNKFIEINFAFKPICNLSAVVTSKSRAHRKNKIQ